MADMPVAPRDIILIDDPHNTQDIESEAERASALNWWREIRSTRLNGLSTEQLEALIWRWHTHG